MPKNNETTTKFRADISELKKAMQEAKRAVAVANSEFKEAASACDDWTKSSTGLSAKLKQLDSNLKNQKNILASLEKQYELTVEEMGEGSKAADDLKVKINNQKAAINYIERDIGKYKDALDEVTEAEKTAAKTGQSVAEVLDDMGDSAEDAEGGFTVLKGAVATFAGNVLTGLASGLRDAASSLLGLADSTREYRTEMGKLETAFTTAGHSTEAATKTYKDLYAVLGDEGQSVEAANHLAKLVDTEEDLAKWTDIATGVYGTFGDSLPIEGLTEAANETAKVGQVTGPLADALNWAGVSEDEFNESLGKCTSEQERQALITETLNGLYSEAADNYKAVNGDIMDANKAQAEYTDTMAEMGEKVEPITTALKEGVTGLLQELLSLVSDVDMEAFTAKIEEGFKVLKDEVLPAVKEGFGWIIENKDALIAGLAGIAAGFVAFKVASLIQGVASAMQGMTVAQYALNLAMSLNPIGLVVAAITALVAAFLYLWNNSESFRNFWIGLWDNIKLFCSNAINAIVLFFTETIPNAINNMVTFLQELPSNFWTWLLATISKVEQWKADMIAKAIEIASNFVGKVIEFIKELPSKIWTWFVNVIAKVEQWKADMAAKAVAAASGFINKVIEYVKQLPSKVWTWLVNVITKLNTWKSNMITKAKEAGKGFVDYLINAITGLPDKMKEIGSSIVEGIFSGISSGWDWLSDSVSDLANSLFESAKEALGINSPSKVFADEVGKWIPEGIAVGVNKNAKSAIDSIRDLAVNTVGTAREGLGSAVTATGGVGGGGVVNNYTQVINSPKQLSRLDIYRQSKNLLGYAGGGL